MQTYISVESARRLCTIESNVVFLSMQKQRSRSRLHKSISKSQNHHEKFLFVYSCRVFRKFDQQFLIDFNVFENEYFEKLGYSCKHRKAIFFLESNKMFLQKSIAKHLESNLCFLQKFKLKISSKSVQCRKNKS